MSNYLSIPLRNVVLFNDLSTREQEGLPTVYYGKALVKEYGEMLIRFVDSENNFPAALIAALEMAELGHPLSEVIDTEADLVVGKLVIDKLYPDSDNKKEIFDIVGFGNQNDFQTFYDANITSLNSVEINPPSGIPPFIPPVS